MLLFFGLDILSVPAVIMTVRRMYFMKALDSQRPKIIISFGSVFFSHSIVANDVYENIFHSQS